MRIVFVESASPVGYVTGSKMIGGAEASVIEVSRGLGKLDTTSVVVTKLPRNFRAVIDGVEWLGLGRRATSVVRHADVLVIQRRVVFALPLRLLNWRATVLVWYHDWIFEPSGAHLRQSVTAVKAQVRSLIHLCTRTTGVVVSKTHERNMRKHLCLAVAGGGRVRLEVIPNPVMAAPSAVEIDFDRDQLIFFSAAWKGLDQVLRAFAAVRARIPSLRLIVASPGYSPHGGEAPPGVTFAGYLRHDELFQSVASSLCVFYAANRVPETFGLVFAESHAVGTPVLAHPFGAATELLSTSELVDVEDIDAIVERISEWRQGRRPKVTMDPRLGLPAVLSEWRRTVSRRR